MLNVHNVGRLPVCPTVGRYLKVYFSRELVGSSSQRGIIDGLCKKGTKEEKPACSALRLAAVSLLYTTSAVHAPLHDPEHEEHPMLLGIHPAHSQQRLHGQRVTGPSGCVVKVAWAHSWDLAWVGLSLLLPALFGVSTVRR